jgi:DNA-binding NarL/FixJ family response regulator
MKSIRILLADDHALVRAGIRRLLKEIPDVEVVGEAADGAEALELAQQLVPDIALLDLAMPGMSGLDATFRFQRELPTVRVAILSMHSEVSYVLEALNAGAIGYVLKQSATEELAIAVKLIAEGKTFLTPAVSRQVVDAYLESEKGVLARPSITPRQREILRLVALGRTSQSIASELRLSTRTVETHRANLMARLGVNNTAELMHEAVRLGFIVSGSGKPYG